MRIHGTAGSLSKGKNGNKPQFSDHCHLWMSLLSSSSMGCVLLSKYELQNLTEVRNTCTAWKELSQKQCSKTANLLPRTSWRVYSKTWLTSVRITYTCLCSDLPTLTSGGSHLFLWEVLQQPCQIWLQLNSTNKQKGLFPLNDTIWLGLAGCTFGNRYTLSFCCPLIQHFSIGWVCRKRISMEWLGDAFFMNLFSD